MRFYKQLLHLFCSQSLSPSENLFTEDEVQNLIDQM